MYRLLAGRWNEPFLLVACLGDMLEHVGNVREGWDLYRAAIHRDERHLRRYDTRSSDAISKMVGRFRDWAKTGFDKPFGISTEEAQVLHVHVLLYPRRERQPQINAIVDAIIRRWVWVDIVDPGMPIEQAHFTVPRGKEIKPRRYPPRDVRHALEAYLLAFEPDHARDYFASWKQTQQDQEPPWV